MNAPDNKTTKSILWDITNGAHQTAAAKNAGVKETEFETWMERGRAGKEPFKAFAEAVDAALNAYELKLTGVVHFAALQSAKPDVSTARWLLTQRFPKNWKPREDAAPIVPVRPDGKAYSAEELRAAADLQEAAAARAKARLEAERKNAS